MTIGPAEPIIHFMSERRVILDWMDEVLADKGWKPKHWADATAKPKIAATTITRFRKDKHAPIPSTRTLFKLAEAAGVDPPGIRQGAGKALQNSRLKFDTPKSVPSAKIIEMDVRASAGAGSVVEYEDETHSWGFPEQWIRAELDAQPANLYIITIAGDSMPGVLEPGDKAIINIADRQPTPPGTFIIHDGLGLVAKRVEHIDHSDPPTIRITSTNPVYEPYERTLEEAHIMGRVVARWERL
jgi:phage repressor protein C with HTH and peptisase S24 domain